MGHHASMRPPNCFGGNFWYDTDDPGPGCHASMRPPNCFGGNSKIDQKYSGAGRGLQ